LGLTLLFLGLQPQQFPPPTSNAGPHPAVERRLPIDQPEVVTPRSKSRRIDMAQLKRDANELAKLASDIPSLVEQANKGLLPKDLNQRLKRIEKLSKQLRQELTQ
jgi:hypothetical protein